MELGGDAALTVSSLTERASMKDVKAEADDFVCGTKKDTPRITD